MISNIDYMLGPKISVNKCIILRISSGNVTQQKYYSCAWEPLTSIHSIEINQTSASKHIRYKSYKDLVLTTMKSTTKGKLEIAPTCRDFSKLGFILHDSMQLYFNL